MNNEQLLKALGSILSSVTVQPVTRIATIGLERMSGPPPEDGVIAWFRGITMLPFVHTHRLEFRCLHAHELDLFVVSELKIGKNTMLLSEAPLPATLFSPLEGALSPVPLDALNVGQFVDVRIKHASQRAREYCEENRIDFSAVPVLFGATEVPLPSFPKTDE